MHFFFSPTAVSFVYPDAGILLALAPSTYVPLPGSSEARRAFGQGLSDGRSGGLAAFSNPRSAVRELIWRIGLGAARLAGVAADALDVEEPVRVVVVPVWSGGLEGSPVELVAPPRELERDVREGRLRVLGATWNDGQVQTWAERLLRGGDERAVAVRARRLGSMPSEGLDGRLVRPLSFEDVRELESVERWQSAAEAFATNGASRGLDAGGGVANHDPDARGGVAGQDPEAWRDVASQELSVRPSVASHAPDTKENAFGSVEEGPDAGVVAALVRGAPSAEDGDSLVEATAATGEALSSDPPVEGPVEFPWPWPWRHHPPPPPPASAAAPPIDEQQITDVVPYKLSWMLNETQAMARSRGLNQDVARTLAALVSVTYCTLDNIRAWNCSRCGHGGAAAGGGGNGSDWSAPAATEPGRPVGVVPSGRMSRTAELAVDSFEMELVLWKRDWDLLGFVGWSPVINGAVVAFRGTDSRSIHNWVHNMKTWRTDLNLTLEGAPTGALVHGGFYESYNSSGLADDVSRSVRNVLWRHPGAPVYCAGHSLGAALATIAALDLRKVVGIPDVRLYTFGSPRVGNYIFARWFQTIVTEHWRFTHNRDIVPSVAPTYMGFWHISREVWIVDYAVTNETLVGFCDATGEDSRCHNSQCLLGLCSSIGDHLLYLSEMYTPHPEGC